MPDTARLLRALTVTTERLFGPDIGYASDEEAILAAQRMIETRETQAAPLFAAWTGRLRDQLTTFASTSDLATVAPDLHARLAAIVTRLDAPAPVDIAASDEAERAIMADWSALSEQLAASPHLSAVARARLVLDIAQAERQRSVERMGSLLPVPVREDHDITAERLRDYLADRFGDSTIAVTAFRPLPGGYGKETILFEVAGTGLDGAFVMRRDRLEPTMDNDCHRIDREYPVIRATYEHGFPAPEALWLDTDHRLLPGGDFLVMRRAPGASGGDVFRAAGAVTPELTALLATSMANLHTLPPLRELGTLSEGIAPELWDLSLREVTERYIRSIRDMYVTLMATPSPAVLAIYGWLLDNIPDTPGRPVLLHGDIGFHNFIIDGARLSAVVDWEFAHIGDPAEDVGYVSNTAGASIEWDAFMAAYRAAGGGAIDEARLRFFRIWGHLRNLTASQLTSNAFEQGRLDELKLGHVGHSMMPMFLDAITAVLAENVTDA